MSFDQVSYAQAWAGPGQDTRMWISLGTVNQDTPEARSVRFVDEEGEPLATGPLVTVTLQPSGITVVCRVGSFIAGNGEGTWLPFQEKDEVLVALPQGSERASPVIVARLNQGLDEWPGIVAGQDATRNAFGFWRLRSPFIIETAEAFLIRSAKTGSQVGIDPTGQVILNNGDKHNVFIGSDAISISSGDENTFIQLNFTENRITAATGDARLELSASGSSVLHVPGLLNIGTAGAAGKGHALTLEQLINFLINFLGLLAGPTGSATLAGELGAPGKLLSVLPTPYSVLDTQLAAMLTAMVTPTPPTPAGTPGGGLLQFPLTFGAITTALASPLPSLDPTGFIPGIGRGSLLY